MISGLSNTRWVSLFLLMVAAFFSAVKLQADLSEKRFRMAYSNPASIEQDVLYIPVDPIFMKLAMPADPEFLADLIWMRTAYYFGEHAMSNRQYPYLLHLLDTITELSPKWELPYLFGAVILPSEGNAVEEGLFFIDKGIQHHPENWQLWFFKGYTLWQYRNDPIEAAKMFHRASLLPGAPAYLATLPATLASKSGQRDIALHFLMEALNQLKDPLQQEMLRKKIRELMQHE
uniref:Tetratricopeptide repeat protein n=1 Tax=Desulfatirhabdium butyrativorans TaxID=340467 RepID=A0A7C4MMX7_9BACT